MSICAMLNKGGLEYQPLSWRWEKRSEDSMVSTERANHCETGCLHHASVMFNQEIWNYVNTL
jgi:hypothetical protein